MEKKLQVLCHCNACNDIDNSYFGGELDCGNCGMTLTVPDTEELLTKQNQQTADEIEEMRFTGRIRVMGTDETGEERHIKTIDGDDEAFVNAVVTGYKAQYEEWRIFTEREENMRYAVEVASL